jgi:hypothetical protein
LLFLPHSGFVQQTKSHGRAKSARQCFEALAVMNMNLDIENYWELLALHKSLMAVKFDPAAYLEEAQGSPFTSSLAFKVFNLLVSSCKSEGKQNEAEKWLSWQQADKNRIETQLLLKRVEESSWWAEADADVREKYVSAFMAPLKLESDLHEQIIKNC